MLNRAAQQGRVVVVVLPVSPPYAREFLPATTTEEYEHVLAEARRRVPAAVWVRLDQLPELHSTDYFWDLVHLNTEGQKIATDALLARLKPFMAER